MSAQDQNAPSLKSENQKLRIQVKALEKQLAKAEKAGFHFIDDGYSSILEILKQLPKRKRRGVRISVKHRVQVKTVINPAYRFDESLPPYRITFEFETLRLPFRGKVFEQILEKQVLVGDEAAKAYAEKLNGKKIVVEGIMTQCAFRKSNGFNKNRPAYVARLSLTQTSYSPPLQK